MARSVTVNEIAELLLEILQNTKDSTNGVTKEKLLTVEQICNLTRFQGTALLEKN